MAYMALAANVGNGSTSFQEESSRTDGTSASTNFYTTWSFAATADPGWTFTRWEMRSRSTSYSSTSGSSTTAWSSWGSLSTSATFMREFLCRNDYDAGIFGSGYTSYEFEVRAVFTGTTYTVTVQADPANSGTVTGGGSYQAGASCTITAAAETGYEFVRWVLSTGATSTSQSYSFTVTQNTTATAYFRQYTGLPLYGSSGTILYGSSGTILCDA